MKKLWLLFILALLVPAGHAQSWSGTSAGDTFVLPPNRFCLGADNGQNVCFIQTGNQIAKVTGTLVNSNGIPIGGGGLPMVSQVTLPNQSVSNSGTVYAVPSNGAGQYLITADVLVTQAGTGGTVGVNINWNNGTTQPTFVTAPFSLASTGEQAALVGNLMTVNAGSTITWSTNVSADVSGSPQFTINFRLLYLDGAGTTVSGPVMCSQLPALSGDLISSNGTCNPTVASFANEVNAAQYYTGSSTFTQDIVAANASAQCASGCTILVGDVEASHGSGAATTPVLGANTNLKFTGSAIFTVCIISAGQFSHIWGHAHLKASGSGCQLISQTNPTTLQVNQQFIVDGGLTLDCNGQTNCTSLYIANHAASVAADLTIINATDTTSTFLAPTAGMVLYGTQFGSFHDLKFYNNYVGMKCYGSSTTTSGCNVNTFDHFTVTGVGSSATPIGALFIQQVSTSGSGGECSYGDIFKNSSFLSEFVAPIAIFGNTAIGTCQTIVSMDHGTTEVNGGGTSVTIDGVTIQEAGVFMSYGYLYWNQVADQEGTLPILIYGTNSSYAFVNHPIGYFGGGTGQFTKMDGTSFTWVDGRNYYQGNAETFQNVLAPNYAADTGAANAAVVTLPNAPAALYAGLVVSFLPVANNSNTAPTLNVNGFGAKTIVKFGTTAMANNDLTTAAIAQVIYDGTNWELQNPQNFNPASSSGAVAALNNLALTNQITKYNNAVTVREGVAAEYAKVDLTAQSAAITATTLLAPTGSTQFEVCWSADITTASDISSTLGGSGGFQVIYTSPTDSVVKTTVATAADTSAANTTGTAVGGCKIVYAKSGTNIQYTFGYTNSDTSVPMAYELHITVFEF